MTGQETTKAADRAVTKKDEAYKFAEIALRLTRRGTEPDKNAIYLAGIIEGFNLKAEIETTANKAAMA